MGDHQLARVERLLKKRASMTIDEAIHDATWRFLIALRQFPGVAGAHIRIDLADGTFKEMTVKNKPQGDR